MPQQWVARLAHPKRVFGGNHASLQTSEQFDQVLETENAMKCERVQDVEDKRWKRTLFNNTYLRFQHVFLGLNFIHNSFDLVLIHRNPNFLITLYRGRGQTNLSSTMATKQANTGALENHLENYS